MIKLLKPIFILNLSSILERIKINSDTWSPDIANKWLMPLALYESITLSSIYELIPNIKEAKSLNDLIIKLNDNQDDSNKIINKYVEKYSNINQNMMNFYHSYKKGYYDGEIIFNYVYYEHLHILAVCRCFLFIVYG